MEPPIHSVPISRILVPADEDPASIAAVDMAAGLAIALDAELVLLAVQSLPIVEAAYPSALAIGMYDQEGDREEAERLLARRIARFSDVLPPAVRARWIRGRHPAGPAIVRALDEVDADLVVMPMRRGSELSHLLNDGTDRHVLHHSPVPVLVVPEVQAR
jgi:nucleotide-binding universal stress UspA family protein